MNHACCQQSENNRRTTSQISDRCWGEVAHAVIDLPSAIKQKRRQVASSCIQDTFILTFPRATAACDVNHPTVSPFPNMAYKSAYVNALEALKSSSVDTSKCSSRNDLGETKKSLLFKMVSCNRVHGVNTHSMMGVESSVLELPTAVRFRMLYASTTVVDASRKIQERDRSENEIKWGILHCDAIFLFRLTSKIQRWRDF
jgi:hypothetical protein